MTRFITLRRAPDGITCERRLSPWTKALYLSEDDRRRAWAGIKQAQPELAEAMTTDPTWKALIKTFQATPVFTLDEFTALMNAGRATEPQVKP